MALPIRHVKRGVRPTTAADRELRWAAGTGASRGLRATRSTDMSPTSVSAWNARARRVAKQAEPPA